VGWTGWRRRLPPVFLLEQAVLDELLPHLVSNLRHVSNAKRLLGLALALLGGLGNGLLEEPGVNRAAVDLSHGGRGQQAGPAGQAAEVEHEPCKKRDGHDEDQRLGTASEGLHHVHDCPSGLSPKEREVYAKHRAISSGTEG
jgi:hypothetical protein